MQTLPTPIGATENQLEAISLPKAPLCHRAKSGPSLAVFAMLNASAASGHDQIPPPLAASSITFTKNVSYPNKQDENDYQTISPNFAIQTIPTPPVYLVPRSVTTPISTPSRSPNLTAIYSSNSPPDSEPGSPCGLCTSCCKNREHRETVTIPVLTLGSPINSIAHDFAATHPSSVSIPFFNRQAAPTPFRGPLTFVGMGGSLGQALQIAHTSSNGIARSEPCSSTSSTAPSSPKVKPIRQNSGTTTPRVRAPATTLSVPGMTKSRASPNGKISQRDVGAKLVIIMVGLPARGKSYITKKIKRYYIWQQHETRIFNVGNRRRIAAGTADIPETYVPPQASDSPPNATTSNCTPVPSGDVEAKLHGLTIRTTSVPGIIDAPTEAAPTTSNGVNSSNGSDDFDTTKLPTSATIEQNAEFFDPNNEKASNLREQLAVSTLDELLDFLLIDGGSVGILDATNSTIERRSILFKQVKAREPKLGILFIESFCQDKQLLEANMCLKLQGPDYKDKDPESSLADFKLRVAAYESAYVPLGAFEELNNMQYIQMIDVGRKIVQFELSGFLVNGIADYLLTFNLSPRQIWITRHGESIDNVSGRIGGDSDLTDDGDSYGIALYNFIQVKRAEWEQHQRIRAYTEAPKLIEELEEKNFCVWTSMLRRSYQTAACFHDDDNYDVKSWENLNELHAGNHEGMTYEEIQRECPLEWSKRKADKLNYVYPGVGGEGYLQIVSRLREIVREIERIKDHVLIVGHRSICRVLMAYFMDLTREDIADLDVPLGMLYAIEPKPYGIEFHAYKYNPEDFQFYEIPNYKPQKASGLGK